MTAANAAHGGCPACGRTDVSLKKNGTLRAHVAEAHRGSIHLHGYCSGGGKSPKSAGEAA